MGYTVAGRRVQSSRALTSLASVVGLVATLALGAVGDAGGTSGRQDAAGVGSYRNDTYAFEVRYPASVVVVAPRGRPEPPPRSRVWFQDRKVATSELAAYQPPLLEVAVYDRPSGASLDSWIDGSGVFRDPGRFAREPARVGTLDAVRLTDTLQLAPNVFYLLARGPFVYRLTPLGELGEQLLRTFRLLPA
jgi:hypothetical protein